MADNRLLRRLAAAFFFVFAVLCWPAGSWADDGDILWPDREYFDGLVTWWDVVPNGDGGSFASSRVSAPAPSEDTLLHLLSIRNDGPATASWTLSSQARYATILSDTDGGAILVYAEGRIDEHGYTIFARRYSRGNNFMWGLQVSTSFDPFMGFSLVNAPIIATDGIGGVYISWRDRLAYVAPDGTLAAPGLDGIKLLTSDPLRPADFRLVPDGTGGIYAAWHLPGIPGLIAQHVQNGLELDWGTNGMLLDPGAKWILSLTDDEAGVFFVGWSEGPSNNSVYVQKYNSDGVSQWAHTGIFVATGITHSDSTQMLADGAGGVFVTWETDAGTFMQRIAANGEVMWPVDVLLTTEQNKHRPMVANGSGGVVLTFSETVFSSDIKAVRIASDGYRLFSRWIRQDGTSPADPGINQYSPKIAFDGSGPDPKGAVILWGEGSPQTEVYGQKIEVSDFGIPANDICANALPITVGQYSGTLVDATNDGSVNCVPDSGEPDVWYSFVSPDDGYLKVTTCGTHDRDGVDSDMNTVVSLHTGCPGTGNNEMACNNDWHLGSLPEACALTDQGDPRDSAVSRFMNAAERLLIRVSRAGNTAGGHFSLHVDFIVDTDGDSLFDDVDNCIDTMNGGQRDSDRDGFGNVCDADFNDDCIINFVDLHRMEDLFLLNDNSPDWDPDVDLNGDGAINFVDLLVMRRLFFATPGPSTTPNICEAGCGLRETGMDPSQHFGVELFVRGLMDDWSAAPPFNLINFGDGVYRSQVDVTAGSHGLKIADDSWTLEYDVPASLLLNVPLILYGGEPDGSPNISLNLDGDGCYNFRIELTEPDSPVPPAQVELTVSQKP